MAKEQISRYQAFMNGLILEYKDVEKGADGSQKVILKNTTSWSPHAYKTLIFTGHDIFAFPYTSAAKKIRIPLSNTFIGKMDENSKGGAKKAENRDDLFAVLYNTPGAIQAKVTNIQDIIIFCGNGRDAIQTADGSSSPQSIARAFDLDKLSAEMQKSTSDNNVENDRCGNLNVIFLDSSKWAFDPQKGIVCALGENYNERTIRKKLIEEKLNYVRQYTGSKSVLMQTKNPPIMDAKKYSINSYIWECKNPHGMGIRQEKKAEDGTFRDVCTLSTGDIVGIKFETLITYADVFKRISEMTNNQAGIAIKSVCQASEYAQTFYASPANYPFDWKLIEYISEYYFKPRALMAEIEKYADDMTSQQKSQTGGLSGTICSPENLTPDLMKIAGSCLNTMLAITAAARKRKFHGFTNEVNTKRSESILLTQLVRVVPMPISKKTSSETKGAEYEKAVINAISMIALILMQKPRTKVDENGNTVTIPFDEEMTAARKAIMDGANNSSNTTYLLEYLYSNAFDVIKNYTNAVKKNNSVVGEDAQFNPQRVSTYPVRMLGGFTVEAAVLLFAQITIMYAMMYESRAFYALGMSKEYYVSPSWQENRHNRWLGKTGKEIAPNSVVVDEKFISTVKMLYAFYRDGSEGVNAIQHTSCWELMFHDGVYRLQRSGNLLDSFNSEVLRGHRYLIERVVHNI